MLFLALDIAYFGSIVLTIVGESETLNLMLLAQI
jgi:hypothetical protein